VSSRTFPIHPKPRSIYPVAGQTNGSYAFVSSYLELVGTENQNHTKVSMKEMWTFFHSFFALSR